MIEKYKKGKEEKLILYVLLFMLVTLETTHFETSLLNFTAFQNAVSIINNKDTENRKIIKREKRIERRC